MQLVVGNRIQGLIPARQRAWQVNRFSSLSLFSFLQDHNPMSFVNLYANLPHSLELSKGKLPRSHWLVVNFCLLLIDGGHISVGHTIPWALVLEWIRKHEPVHKQDFPCD